VLIRGKLRAFLPSMFAAVSIGIRRDFDMITEKCVYFSSTPEPPRLSSRMSFTTEESRSGFGSSIFQPSRKSRT
jgi:hypothetical protein